MPSEPSSSVVDSNGNRTSLSRTGATADGSCASSGGTTTSWSYDAGDRLTSAGNGIGAYQYDEFSRATTIPAGDTPAGAGTGPLTLGYFDNDSAASITQAGTTTKFTLDTAGRRATEATGPTGGAASETLVRHYTDTSDNPTWVEDTVDGAKSLSRYATSLGGDLAATITTTPAGATSVALPLVDLHGDAVTTVDVPTSGSCVGIDAWVDHDEYGNPIDSTAGVAGTVTDGVGYGWLGGKQRATHDSGLILMGARLYNRVTGQFTSLDPVFGGGDTAYAYPSDPINQFDLDGRHWYSSAWRTTKRYASRAWSGTRRVARGVGVSGGACAGYIFGGCVAVSVNYYDGFGFSAGYTGRNRALYGFGAGGYGTWQSRATGRTAYCGTWVVYQQCNGYGRNRTRQYGLGWGKGATVGVYRQYTWSRRFW